MVCHYVNIYRDAREAYSAYITVHSPLKSSLWKSAVFVSTDSMRSFQFFFPIVILALLLQCQGVPIEDFFPTDGLSSSSAETIHFHVLATACGGGVTQLDVCFASHFSFNCPTSFNFMIHLDNIDSTGWNS